MRHYPAILKEPVKKDRVKKATPTADRIRREFGVGTGRWQPTAWGPRIPVLRAKRTTMYSQRRGIGDDCLVDTIPYCTVVCKIGLTCKLYQILSHTLLYGPRYTCHSRSSLPSGIIEVSLRLAAKTYASRGTLNSLSRQCSLFFYCTTYSVWSR